MSGYRPFQRVGIVNRGEPAIRFIRAARAWSAERGLPLEVVAFYTDADRRAPFVREADLTVSLGEALVVGVDGKRRSAYLDVPRIVRLLRGAGCDAAWPGWGFLSENPAFVDALSAAGIVFIGPPAEAMRMVGDKIAAKLLAQAHGVPVTPWSNGPVSGAGEARACGSEIGFPVLLKAAAGGGGRGIRVVHSPEDIEALFSAASAEALSAFGDGTLLVEALVPEARHIEVQVLADSFGHVYALGTRDCSMQRRHQKVIEEAPASGLSPAIEEALQDAAITIARAVGYVSAGTAEFLVLPDGSGFAFLEMNTRLQVEHPVTECITGIDLVKAQIEIARGEPLHLDAVTVRGHAIEARLNAEDPDAQFAPSAGQLLRFDPPSGPGIRVDSGFVADGIIPTEFDSMLAKIIATGRTRHEARARLESALSCLTVAIEGGSSNRALLLELIRHPAFRESHVTTRWLDRYLTDRLPALRRPLLDVALTAAAIGEYEKARRGDVLNFLKDAHRGAVPVNPPISEPRSFRFHVDGRTATIEVATVGPRRYRISDGQAVVFARFELADRSTGVLTLSGRRYSVVFTRTPHGLNVEVDGTAHRLSRASDGRVVAPVPAAVSYIHVKPGALVQAGQRIATLEVMKMEMAIEAPVSGRVARVMVDSGSRVAAGDVVALIEAEQDQASGSPLQPLSGMPGASVLGDWGSALSRLRGALLGYDLPPGVIDQATSALRDEPLPPVDDLLDLIDAYIARERLFERSSSIEGAAPVDHFAHYLRLPRARGEGLPSEFLALLRRALSFYDLNDLFVTPVLESALLRLAQARRRRDEHDSILFSVLAALDRCAGEVQAPSRTRGTLETLAVLVADRNQRLVDAVWSTLYLLCDRPQDESSPEPAEHEIESGTAEELSRFEHFHLERLPSPREVYVGLARAKNDPGDERIVAIVELDRLELETLAFHRSYLVALHGMREAISRLKGGDKLIWNRIVVLVREPLPGDRAQLERGISRLALPASGIGLEKISILGRTVEGREVAVRWSAPMGHGAAVEIADRKHSPVKPLTSYERRVIEARRRGLFYPYELVRLLSGTQREGALPVGSFQELDLDGSGTRLAATQRPLGYNEANLVVGLIENRFAPFEDGLQRVLIIGDSTKGMGALSEAECRRVIAAFDLAAERQLPVEWVPVSAGAKIAWDSGTENLDWTARVLARIIEFTQAGGVVNIVVDGVCVGAQSYWNAEATMLQHCKGTLIMTPRGSMLLTGKRALEFAGSVSAEDNQGIGGYERIMGPNGEAQYFAPDLVSAYRLLFRHYALTHVPPGESRPRRLNTEDKASRDVTVATYSTAGDGFNTIGEIFDETSNPGRKRPFGIRELMRAVVDQDIEPLERWSGMQGAESAVAWEACLGGTPVSCIGVESKPVRRLGERRADGPEQWTAGTLFPLSSKKVARALSVASGVRPAIVLANLSGFDGSPESLRNLQLEYGAEIGRAVVNFRGPLIFCVVSRYHGGAYVVFSRALNSSLQALALTGSYASVIGGGPAAAVVFPGLIKQRVRADPEVMAARVDLDRGSVTERTAAQVRYEQTLREAHARAHSAIAREFDAVHTVERAREVGSLATILKPSQLRAELIRCLEA